MIFLVASKEDVAAMNIANQLIANHDFNLSSKSFCCNPVYQKELGNKEYAELMFIETAAVDTQCLQLPALSRLLIFLSRHSSKSGKPTLSVHTPGNLGEAALGGLPRRVSVSPANAMRSALKAMKRAQEEMSLNYEVSYECTHHGPSLDIPTMFVELGSSPDQWKDLEAAEAVAEGALAAAANTEVCPAVLGIGGPHYNGKFTAKALETETAFGHIVPKYAVREIDAEALRQCIDKTVERIQRIILDWKGISSNDKSRLLPLLDETGLEVEKI